MGFKRTFESALIGTKQGWEADNLVPLENGLRAITSYRLTFDEIRDFPVMSNVPLIIQGMGCINIVTIVAVHQYGLTKKTVVEFILSAEIDEGYKECVYQLYKLNEGKDDESPALPEPVRKRR